MQPITSEPTLFDHYFEFVEETEPPLIFHRWSLITCLSAMLGKQCWIPFGMQRIFPNQFVMLIGEPGTRKSTSIKIARKIIASAGYKSFAAEKTTKEKFLLDLEGVEEASDQQSASALVMENLFGDTNESLPKEVFIVADEFNDFMHCGDLEFHSMLGALWDYDDETTPYKQRLKNSKSISIYQPTINLLGGNTHTGFAQMFPPQAIGQGFLSRMLLVFSEPSGRKIAFPPVPDAKAHANLVSLIQKIKTDMVGPLELSPKARQMLTVLYNSYEGFSDVRFTSYFTRRYTHLLKLCIICAAVRVRRTIGVEEVLLANTILRYTEHFMPKALGEFGKARNSDVANRLLQLLSKTHTPVGFTELWKQVSSDLDKQEDLAKMMENLATAGKVQQVKAMINGKPGLGFLMIRKPLGQGEVYTQYNLLKEYDTVKPPSNS